MTTPRARPPTAPSGDKQLGQRIQVLREPRTRQQLVDSMNLARDPERATYTVGWLKLIETGHRGIAVADLAVLADVLGVSIDAVARGHEPDSLASITAPYEGRISKTHKDLLRQMLADWARR